VQEIERVERQEEAEDEQDRVKVAASEAPPPVRCNKHHLEDIARLFMRGSTPR